MDERTQDAGAERAASRLGAGDEAFRAIVDGTSAVIFVKDVEGRYLYVNRRFEQLLQVTRAAVEGKTDHDLFPRETADELARSDRLVVEGGRPVEVEARIPRDDGVGTFIADKFPLTRGAGEIYAICGIATDITARKRAEAELEENREKYRGLSEAAFESIFISEKGICLEQNRTAEQTFGYGSAEAIGRSGIEWIAEPDRALVLQNMLAGYEEPYKVRALRKDGTTFPVIIRGKMVHYRGRTVRVTSLSDITELERAEAELRQAQKMDLLGTLAGGIAHDFNNVLAVVLAEASVAHSELPDGPTPLREALSSIVTAAEMGAALTKRLLTFARPEKRHPHRVVELGALLRGLQPMLRRLTPAHVELHLEVKAPCPALVDSSQIEQVVVNLVVNARDAIAGAGRIAVVLEPTRLDAGAEVPGPAPATHARLTVSDTGRGIAGEVIDRIFDPFFTTKPLGQGTGLGLAVVMSIVNLHRGVVTVRSAPGQGTRFEVLLPLAEGADVQAPTPAPSRARARPGETILLAEDEPAVRRTVTHLLEGAGYRVLAAADGPAALELYRRHAAEIGLVMLDVVMPGMPGRRVYEALLAMGPPRPRVLFSSGYSPDEDDPALLPPPGCRSLPKPYQASELLAVVRAMLDAEA